MNLTYYVELKKPDTKENIIHDSIRMKSINRLHQSKAMGKQNGGDLEGDVGWGRAQGVSWDDENAPPEWWLQAHTHTH